jgi:hypothetical protein
MAEFVSPDRPPGRHTPAHGVKLSLAGPTIVLLTVNTKDRVPWLAQAVVHDSLREIWHETDAWLVGDYVLMPDHLHLFCAPRDLAFTLERWLAYWKSRFSAAGMWTSRGRGSGRAFTTGCAMHGSIRKNGRMCGRIPCAKSSSPALRTGRIREPFIHCVGNG